MVISARPVNKSTGMEGCERTADPVNRRKDVRVVFMVGIGSTLKGNAAGLYTAIYFFNISYMTFYFSKGDL